MGHQEQSLRLMAAQYFNVDALILRQTVAWCLNIAPDGGAVHRYCA
jgi:hypothetical protein